MRGNQTWLFVLILCYSIFVFLMMFAFVTLNLVSPVLDQEIVCEEHARSDLFCVERDVKPSTVRQKELNAVLLLVLLRFTIDLHGKQEADTSTFMPHQTRVANTRWRYTWTGQHRAIRVRWRCGVLSNYFDHLFN